MKNKYLYSIAVLVLTSSTLLNSTAIKAETITNSDINSVQNELNELGEKYTELELQRKETEQSLTYLEDEKQQLENTLRYLIEHLNKKEDEIVELNYVLSDLKNSLVDTENALSKQEETFKTRLNSMYRDYMTSDMTYLNVLLNSDGFMEIINSINNYKKIMDRDAVAVESYLDLISSIQTNQEETTELLNTLESKMTDLEGIVHTLEDTIRSKALIEVQLETMLKTQTSEVNAVSIEINEKNIELENLVKKEKERIEEENRLQREREEANKVEAEKSHYKNTDKTVEVDTTTKFTFEGDSEFRKYQESINWSRRNMSEETLNTYYAIIEQNSARYGVPTALIKAIIQTESSFRKDTTNVNSNGTVDRGLMQMNSNTAPSVAKQLGLTYSVGIEFIPEKNIQMGTYYFSKSYDASNLHKGLTSYNRGVTGAKNFYAKNGTYESEYSKKVLAFMEVFKKEEEESTKNIK